MTPAGVYDIIELPHNNYTRQGGRGRSVSIHAPCKGASYLRPYYTMTKTNNQPYDQRGERPVPVELTGDAVAWYDIHRPELSLWTGSAAPDWAAGARTLDRMAYWSRWLGEQAAESGDTAGVRQWTGTPPTIGDDAAAGGRLLGGLYAKYAGCRRWWTSWQAEHMDGTETGNMVLLDTKSCHDPLCPLCMRLKAHKREIAYTAAWTALQARKLSRDGAGYKLLQVVLDVGRNVSGDDLRGSLSRLISGTQRYIRWLHEVKGVVATAPPAWIWGEDTDKTRPAPLWMLGTEITRHNQTDPLQGTYHPHVHLVLAVYSSAIRTTKRGDKVATWWRERAGITRAEMLDKWREIMGDPTITNLYMGEVDNPHQALKYAVKGAIGKQSDTGDAALYVAGDEWDTYNMETLRDVHDAIVDYRHDSRNRSRQMFRASAGWAHLAVLKAAELKIALDDTDADDTVQDSGGIGHVVRGRQRRGIIEATSVDADRLSLTEARDQIRLEQSLRHTRRANGT